jgi:hypothetical protein
MRFRSALVSLLLFTAAALYGQTEDTLVSVLGCGAGNDGRNHITVKWEFASESPCLGYYLQRSIWYDHQNLIVPFQRLTESFQPWCESTTGRHLYSYYDTAVTIPAGAGKVPWVFYRLERADSDGSTHIGWLSGISLVTSATDQRLPAGYALWQNYPNPYNPTTKIVYGLPSRGRLSLDVYDALGRKVMSLVEGDQEAGMHTVTFDGSELSSGIYFYRLTTSGVSQVKKMILEK